ncbi:MAG: ABC transporter permease [Geodermatophilaceae bacterium]|nr:ABC transporter permease [Geodermatophilaceae bacterium]
MSSTPTGSPDLGVGAAAGTPEATEQRSASLWADAWRELVHNPVFIISGLLVLLVVSVALFPTLWTDADPEGCFIARAYEKPSDAHVFGTTVQGCDMYATVIYGARPSLIIAVVVTLLTTLIGMATGIAAGFFGGMTDTIISRVTDVFLGLPFLLGALVFLALLSGRKSIWTVSGVLILLSWPPLTRVMRGSVIAVKSQDYVEAARALGASNWSIIRRHVVPNSIAPVIVLGTLYLGTFVSAEATLTFLGVGLQVPDISWGITIAEGQLIAIGGFPHLLIFPSAAVIITVMSFILLGDALRDALDPKSR